MEQDDVPFPCKGCGEVCANSIRTRGNFSRANFYLPPDRSLRRARLLNLVSCIGRYDDYHRHFADSFSSLSGQPMAYRMLLLQHMRHASRLGRTPTASRRRIVDLQQLYLQL